MRRILICHRDVKVSDDLAELMIMRMDNLRIHGVRNLTEAYNVTEHRLPDCLVIEAALAELPEVELLFALAKLLGVHCVKLAQPDYTAKPTPKQDLATYCLDAPLDVLFSLIGEGTPPRPRPNLLKRHPQRSRPMIPVP